MEYEFNSTIIEPYLYSRDSIITDVNKEFIEFTGYALGELIGKSLIEIGDMLKISSQILLDNINSDYTGFIFTKFLEPREVNITLINSEITNQKEYVFVEKSKSRLNDKLIFVEQTFIENISGAAVYSVPDLILLKANESYLNFQGLSFNKEENSIGKSIREIVTGFAGSQIEVIWNTLLQTQKTSYSKEFKFDEFERGITYWDSIRTPIFEGGKIKYIFVTTCEVTERVLKNQSIERQNKIIQQQKEQLQQQNTQLISIIENLSGGVMIVDNKSEIIRINPEAIKLVYQLDRVNDLAGAFKNTKIFDMAGNEISLEDFPSLRALRGEIVKNVKMFIRQPNNEYFVEISSIPIYNTNGDLTMVVSCFHDITETIEQSRKIEEQKKELEAIIENIADGISIFDNDEKYILYNKSEREMFSPFYEHTVKTSDWYKQAELFDALGGKLDSENTPSRRIMRGEKFKNMRMVVKLAGKTLQVDVSGTPIYDSEGKFTLGVLCNRDMTDYFKHEEAIRSRYEFLNRMVDTFDLPVVRLSCPDLKIVNLNKNAFNIAKLFRSDIKSISEINGSRIEYLFEIFQTTEYSQIVNEVLKEKKTKYLNRKKYLVNGNEIYWNIIFEPMLEVNGKLQEILILIVDVTAEIKSNIIMEKALKSQEEFIVNISHELKTPLNVIYATVQLLNMYCNSDSLEKWKDSFIKYIDSMKQNCFRLSKLINNIVDSSKIEAGFFELNLSNNNIVEVVEDIVMSVTNFTKIKGLNIIFDTDTEEKIINCDPEKVERIVLNIISNAIKFSHVGGEILVDIKDKNEFVQISVKDDGIGIEANQLDVIFDRFKQVDKSLSRNAEGTGIGLSLVKAIVELHGGSIYVESVFGKGSKFIVMLPSKNVPNGDVMQSNKITDKKESIQLELSDVY
ncbi:PAS domain-containing protein [Clostridium bowmanii]|uniref:ATP-binding protein n=1 Tax=Clostridium bowmanii TaxID=132925 RepID=UPI001C0DEFC5|nr:ATP-binding protein [Clostridium bowmanii]MBU3191599.1 PAS domain-containing protein [Clostridium bowmanii]MCA1075927.1 PAS domain-containing protein [Clostridium bowmanii]